MKRQMKNLPLASKGNEDKPRTEIRPCNKAYITELIGSPKSPKERIRPKIDLSSPSNKQNQYKCANQIDAPQSPLCPLSPLQCSHLSSKSPNSFKSPARTISAQNLTSFLSNKGKEAVQEQPGNSILFTGLSKDGKYKIESHSLQGEELRKACEHERKVSVITRINSKKDGGNQKIPHIEPAKTASKENGVIKSYAVNTHQGISRTYNQDRVSITLNIKKKGVRAQFFAIYDGHGGHCCCDYLKDSLHELLINSQYFPSEPKKALAEAFAFSECIFSKNVKNNKGEDGSVDRSGSCAIITLLVDDTCYVANVGDSRAIMSSDGGKMAFNLSRDHRPSDIREQERVLSAGGKIYRTEMTRVENKGDKIIGPLRILPGKLSVSRTIGDIEAKEPELGGNRGSITAQPDIRKFKLTGKEDFIVLCCDGVLERIESMETVQLVWNAVSRGGSMHQKAGRAVDSLIEESMRRKSTDNLTAILICFKELQAESYNSPRKSDPREK